MHKYLTVMLLAVGAAWAQIPERNCMSNPMMDGCPAAEQTRKTQELWNKKPWWEEHPELLNPKAPGSKQITATPQGAATTRPNPAADTDWKRPRLTKALAADWPRWIFAEPDAGALVGMKLTALSQSPVIGSFVGADAGKQWRGAAPSLDEVWISMRTLPGNKTEAVMLLTGPGVESIASDLRSKGVTVCFLDTRTLLAGEWNAVNRALTRVIAGAPGPMSKRAGELWASNDVWMIAGRQMINQVLPPSVETAGLTGVSLGLSLQSKVAIDMLLTSATPVETARWATKLSKDPSDLGLGQVSVEKTLRGVSVKAAFDAAELPDALRRQITDQIRPVLDLAQPTPASEATARGAIVIQGLDDGPKVIPVQK
jgi:hypothetical protein